LSLAIEQRQTAGRLPRLRQMLPASADAPFDDEAWFFEPWWPGTPALAYLEGGALRLQTEHLADANTAFPELAGIGRQFEEDGLIVGGTLLVLDDEGRPDGELLRRRLADPATEGDAAFVAAELLFAGGAAIDGQPFGERRARLATLLREGERCVISRGLRGEGTTLADAVATMGLGEISGRLLSAPYRAGQRDESWLRMPVERAPTLPTRPLLALLQRLPL
jgi:bifunctional non-homologous end joining protein LigD